MNDLTIAPEIQSMSLEAINRVRDMEAITREMPQVPIETLHSIHAGVYTRTVTIPAGVLITGVLIRIPTTLIVQGDTTVFLGDGTTRLQGYHVLHAAANRKQAFFAHEDTNLTMIFQTSATTVEEAEEEFTEEAHTLITRR